MSIQFKHEGFHYSIICCGQTVESNLYKVTVWNNKGQQVDVFEIEANTIKEAKDRIINS